MSKLILIIITMGVIGGGFLFYSRNKQPKVTPQIAVTTPQVAEEITSVPSLPIQGMQTYTNSSNFFSFQYPQDYTFQENMISSADGVKVATPNTIELLSPTIPNLNTNYAMRITYEGGAGDLESQMKTFNLSPQDMSNFKPYTNGSIDGFIYRNAPVGLTGSTIILFRHPEQKAYKNYMITVSSQASFEQVEEQVNQILSTWKYL